MILNDKIYNNAINYLGYLLLLYPAILISGALLSDIVTVIFSLFFFTFFFYSKKYLKEVKFLIFFFLFLLIVSFLHQNIIYFFESVSFLRFILFSIIGISIFRKNYKFKDKFFFSLIIILSFFCLDAYIQLLFEKNIFGLEKNDPKRLSGLFGDEYILGSYLLFISPLIFYTCPEDKKIQNIILVFFFLIIMPLIFFSGQRTAFILSIVLAAGVLISYHKKIIAYLAFAIYLTIILFNLLYSDKYNERFISDIKDNVGYDTNIQIGKKSEILDFSYISPIHTKLLVTSYNMFLDKKILGHGIKSFRDKCINYQQCSTHPHNFYFQLLAETGIFGFLFLIIFFIIICYKYLRNLIKIIFFNNKNLIYINFLHLGLIIHLLPLRPQGNIFNNHHLCLLFFFLIFYICEHSKAHDIK